MEVKILTKENYNEAMKIYALCFEKAEKNIELPLLGDLLGFYIDDVLIGITQIDYINNLFENKKIAYINSFCIKKEYQNKGYGDLFFKQCINYLKQNDVDKINLTSNKTRKYAHLLYKKNGFEIIDTILLNKDLK